jgi:hypothetical protein
MPYSTSILSQVTLCITHRRSSTSFLPWPSTRPVVGSEWKVLLIADLLLMYHSICSGRVQWGLSRITHRRFFLMHIPLSAGLIFTSVIRSLSCSFRNEAQTLALKWLYTGLESRALSFSGKGNDRRDCVSTEEQFSTRLKQNDPRFLSSTSLTVV